MKGHSQGEYVFDHGWAQAFERAGGRGFRRFVAGAGSARGRVRGRGRGGKRHRAEAE